MPAIIDGSVGSQFPTTIGVGNATPSGSGAGITFPATQVPSADANTLDDYEEGTFTPTVGGNATPGTVSYSQQVGRYTKIGRHVTVTFMITTSSTISGASGVLLIYGLPFGVASGVTLGGGGGSIGYTNGLATNITTSSIYSDSGSVYMVPVFNSASSGSTYWLVAAFQNSSTVTGSFSYITS